MEKMTVNPRKFFDKERQFSSDDMPKIRKMVKEVIAGRMSQREASEQHNVTRHQVRKWVDLLKNQIIIADKESFSDVMKIKIVRQISAGELSHREAAEKYNVSRDMLKNWMQAMPGLKSIAESSKFKDHELIDARTKVETVRAIQSGQSNLFNAARKLGVTRYRVRTWINEYAMFNLEGNIDHQILSNMPSEEKEKELLEQIESLKKQLEEKKLKIVSLETLIDVAEEKFNIRIKKKPGSKQ